MKERGARGGEASRAVSSPGIENKAATVMKHYIFLLLSAAYLLNFTMGVFELPDNLPLIGNLDELGASALLLHSAQAIRKKRTESKIIDQKVNR